MRISGWSSDVCSSDLFAGLGSALALAACSATGSGGEEVASTPDAATPAADGTEQSPPFPSTYKAYPGEPTALVGATVFDCAGGRIDNGTVLLRDGKVEAIDTGLATEGFRVSDAEIGRASGRDRVCQYG